MITWDEYNRERPAEFTDYEEAWYALSAAILKQTVDDWRKTNRLRPEITRFIKSDYFMKITNIDPEYMLKMLKETYPTPRPMIGMVKG